MKVMDVFDWLVAPKTAKQFWAEHFERQPLVVSGRASTYFDPVLRLDDLDRLLTARALPPSAFRMVRDGQPIDRLNYVRARPDGLARHVEEVDPSAVFGLYQDGASMVFEALNRQLEPVGDLCRAIEDQQRGVYVRANAYLSPARARGLPLHFDTHDVFVLQLWGTKTWTLREPKIELPLPGQFELDADLETPPILEALELTPGDLLYLPRGVSHVAQAGDQGSAHLTIGFEMPTWLDEVVATAKVLAREDIAWRRSALAASSESTGLGEELAAQLGKRLVQRRLRGRGAPIDDRRRPHLRHQLLALGHLDSLTLETMVERRSTYTCTVEVEGPRASLSFGSQVVGVPRAVKPSLDFIAQNRCFRPRELPDELTSESKLLLTRKLIAQGLLVPVDVSGSRETKV